MTLRPSPGAVDLPPVRAAAAAAAEARRRRGSRGRAAPRARSQGRGVRAIDGRFEHAKPRRRGRGGGRGTVRPVMRRLGSRRRKRGGGPTAHHASRDRGGGRGGGGQAVATAASDCRAAAAPVRSAGAGRGACGGVGVGHLATPLRIVETVRQGRARLENPPSSSSHGAGRSIPPHARRRGARMHGCNAKRLMSTHRRRHGELGWGEDK